MPLSCSKKKRKKRRLYQAALAPNAQAELEARELKAEGQCAPAAVVKQGATADWDKRRACHEKRAPRAPFFRVCEQVLKSRGLQTMSADSPAVWLKPAST